MSGEAGPYRTVELPSEPAPPPARPWWRRALCRLGLHDARGVDVDPAARAHYLERQAGSARDALSESEGEFRRRRRADYRDDTFEGLSFVGCCAPFMFKARHALIVDERIRPSARHDIAADFPRGRIVHHVCDTFESCSGSFGRVASHVGLTEFLVRRLEIELRAGFIVPPLGLLDTQHELFSIRCKQNGIPCQQELDCANRRMCLRSGVTVRDMTERSAFRLGRVL